MLLSETRPNVSIRRLARIRREIELIVIGMKVPEILKTLHAEGYRISEPTFYRDLRYAHESSDPQDILVAIQVIKQELIRKQLADITLASRDHPSLAMKYRAHIIELLTPRQIEQKIEGGIKINLDYGGLQPKQPKAQQDA